MKKVKSPSGNLILYPNLIYCYKSVIGSPTYGPNESLYDREPYYHRDQFLEGQENFGPD